MYNWQLYDNWCQAARDLDIELESETGGCIKMKLPKHIQDHFFWMLWTPLNTVDKINSDRDWLHKMWTLRDNSSDFHIEASLKYSDYDNHYDWFPEIQRSITPTVEDIRACVSRMLDQANWPKYDLASVLVSPNI